MAYNQLYFSEKRILNTTIIVIAVCILLVSSYSVYLNKSFPFEKEKLNFTPHPKYLELVSGSFKSFVADFFYISGVLAIAEKFKDTSTKVNWVQKNFDVAISLDPNLIQAYFFAGIVVVQDKESTEKGIEFLEKGLSLKPDEWRIPYWIGFNYYQLGEYLKAVDYYKKASESSQAPGFLKSNQAMLYYKAGRPDLGLMYFEGLLKSIKDPQQLEWIKQKFQWLKNIVILEEKISEFKASHGFLPTSLDDLVEYKLIKNIPDDPFGKGYYLDSASGKVRSRFSSPRKEGSPDTDTSACPVCAD